MADNVVHDRDLDNLKNRIKSASEDYTRKISNIKQHDISKLDSTFKFLNRKISEYKSKSPDIKYQSYLRLRDLTQASHKIITGIYDTFIQIVSDVEIDNWKHNESLYKTVWGERNKKQISSIIELFDNNIKQLEEYKYSDKTTENLSEVFKINKIDVYAFNDTTKQLDRTRKYVELFIGLKKGESSLFNKISSKGVLGTVGDALVNKYQKAKTGLGILPNTSGAKTAGRLLGAGVGLAGAFGAAMFKSSGIAVASGAFMVSRQKKIEKEKEQYKKNITEINKYRTKVQDDINKFRREQYWKDVDSDLTRFAGGTNSVVAKNNNRSILIGDNSPIGRGVERIDTKKSNGMKFSKLTSGPELYTPEQGEEIKVTPISSKPNPALSNINRNDFKSKVKSSFAGGTDFDKKSLSIEEQQLVVLKEIERHNQEFIDTMNDNENRSKGAIATKLPEKMSQAQNIATAVKDKGLFGALGDVVKTAILTTVATAALGKVGKMFGGKFGLGKDENVQKVYVVNADEIGDDDGGGISDLFDRKSKKGGIGKASSKIDDVLSSGKSGIDKGILKGGMKAGIRSIPLLGGLIGAGLSYKSIMDEGGSKSEAVGGAAGSGIGGTIGGAAGLLAGPLAPVMVPLGGIAGSMIGEFVGKKLGGLFSDEKKSKEEIIKKEEESKEGFWDKLSSSENPLLKGVGAAGTGIRNTFSAAKNIISNPFQTFSEIKGRLTKKEGKANESLMMKELSNAGVTDPKQQAMMMGQLSHESMGFTRMTEVGGGQKYEGRKDLGNTQVGDGDKFKGRGFIQLTGRSNYTAAGKALGLDLVNNPDLAAQPDIAAKIATWYMMSRKGVKSSLASGDVVGLTRAINGGINGLEDRVAKTKGYMEGGLSAIQQQTQAINAQNRSTPNVQLQQSAIIRKENADTLSMTPEQRKSQGLPELTPKQIIIAKKKIGLPIAPNPVDIKVSSTTKKTPVPQVKVLNSKVEESNIEIQQAKMQQQATKTQPINNTTVVNNSSQQPNVSSSSPNVNVSSGDSSWASLLIKGYGA